jgi:alanyl-tRNA synthetase
MTDRLYYDDSFLYDFDAEVRSVVETPRPAVVLDRTAFYPTSGGQVHDTGWLVVGDEKHRVTEVVDAEDGRVVHYLDAPVKNVQPGTRVPPSTYSPPPSSVFLICRQSRSTWPTIIAPLICRSAILTRLR